MMDIEVSGFTLAEELFVAGNTRVCRATRRADGRPVVLKILVGDYLPAEAFSQFRREYEIANELADIDGVIKLVGVVDFQDTLAIVEEDIGGRSLAAIMADGPLAPVQALKLTARLARILGGAHHRRVIHKDICPANIVWNPVSDEMRLIDFGIASRLNLERQEFQSVSQLEGSLPYISPEQTGRVNRGLDYRSDLYSLGATLYHLLTGSPPFPNRQGIELVHAHIALTPPPLQSLAPAVPLHVAQIVSRLMAKMAEDRYQSAWGLEHDLLRCLDALHEHGRIDEFPLGARDASIRFHIPQRLYGRDREHARILAAFDRAASGGRELLLIGGGAGTGKTALVQEVHRPLTAKRGNFVAGKFDQYQRDIPFHAWTLAFEQFCQLLLKDDEASLTAWRERLRGALGALGKVVAEVVPSIELIIGPQPQVPPLAGEQAQNRLNVVFGRLLAAICRPEHPLVLFIDDWQWTDAGSLALLKSVLSNPEINHLLLIGAYRDNEVHGTHPFAPVREELRRTLADGAEIALSDLGPTDVEALTRDALHAAPGVEKLARRVFEQTHGNAFFVVQLLWNLADQGLLSFDATQQRWHWSEAEIAARGIADNVVALMAGKIARLAEATRQVLVDASCIGDRFDLDTLATIRRQPRHEVAAALDAALIEGILTPIGVGYRVARQPENAANAYYQFIHDRVRQAAYSMLDADAAARRHHEIARTWVAAFDAAEQESRIFDLANQFNASGEYVLGSGGVADCAAINLRAGKRAKAATAHTTALRYFEVARRLLGDAAWRERGLECAELHLLSAESAFLAKDYETMEACVDAYLARVADALGRVKALKVRLQAYVAQNRLSEAVDVALAALSLLGVVLPKAPSGAEVQSELVATFGALQEREIPDLLENLPPMLDPLGLAAMDLLGLSIPPAYWTSQELVALIICRMVRTTLAQGYSPYAGYGFSWWAITECALLGDIDAGCDFGEFAIELAKKRDLSLQQPLFFAAWIIRKFRAPLRETLPVFEQTYALALEKGDYEYASYARNNQIQAMFHCGRDLGQLLAEAQRAHHDLQRLQIGSSLYWHDIFWQVAKNFVDSGDDPQLLAGPAYDERVNLPRHAEAKDLSTLFLAYFGKLLLACHFGQREAARSAAAQARAHVKGGVGMHAFALFHFYESLALLAGDAAGVVDRAARRTIAANQRQLGLWADKAPMNYRQHWLLIEAERLRVARRYDHALRRYDKAIDAAHANGFVHEEALACELAGRCLLWSGRERMAGHYLRQAHQLYERWGASAKAAALRSAYAHSLPAPALDGRTTAGSFSVSAQHGRSGSREAQAFDIAAVAEAARAISSSIVIDQLISILLKIAIEHAGAQQALLLLKSGGALNIEALGTAEPRISVSVKTIPLDQPDALPLARSVVQYVARTGKALVIADARQEPTYAHDPYVARARPLSVLCQPIVHHGRTVGMLYLENNLTAGAFTAERLQLLELLSSQAAISLENAKLYRDLERKVEERTQKLQDSLLTQERLNLELQASSQQLEQAHAQLRDANARLQQQANTDGLTGLANRRLFSERLRYEFDRCARDQQPLGVILCDLDNFKRYNDTYGHVAGDDCLKAAARALESVFNRAIDLVARFGGEEFVILVPMTPAEKLAAAGEAIRVAIAAMKLPHSGNGAHGVVTISVGCHAAVPVAGSDEATILAHADAALYKAKAGGRNRVVLAD